ncbi:MAG: hypothetical protein HXN58_08685 [Prevotella pallens]|uniref:DUF6621 family protein n=1 Tax=Prevotella pallens TaxID=60133 RepID=UPI001CB49E90|nr:DUF6621 family protein [Prevotella pallens]MBF1443782.1 hypothetical protein [Prevotella pallens]MBF1515381.1 hypothetical protein [Prevotella pallens]
MNTQNSQNIKMSENIIIVDADYIDKVAFNLIVNFERMLNRKIPAADFSQWIVDVALDGRLKPGNHETQVVLLHDKNKATLENFVPSDFQRELDKQAFADEKLGEFIINTIATGSALAEKDDVLLDVLRIALSHDEVHRIMLVPNAEEGNICSVIRNTVKDVDDEHKHISLFAMMPMEGGNFKQQILGYSLMNAMGITSQEIDKSIR